MLLKIPNLFVGEADDCERLISSLQYCAFSPLDSPLTNDAYLGLLGKGALYKHLYDLQEFALVDRVFYIMQKFSEYGDR